jgi:hypothetical protein
MVDTPPRPKRPLGWGASLAVAGMAIFAVGILFLGWAYDSMTVDRPGQWTPILVALGIIGGLTIGLGLRSRIAYTLAMAVAGYMVLTSVSGMVQTRFEGPWASSLISIVPAALVLIGLAVSWRAFWRPYS